MNPIVRRRRLRGIVACALAAAVAAPLAAQASGHEHQCAAPPARLAAGADAQEAVQSHGHHAPAEFAADPGRGASGGGEAEAAIGAAGCPHCELAICPAHGLCAGSVAAPASATVDRDPAAGRAASARAALLFRGLTRQPPTPPPVSTPVAC